MGRHARRPHLTISIKAHPQRATTVARAFAANVDVDVDAKGPVAASVDKSANPARCQEQVGSVD